MSTLGFTQMLKGSSGGALPPLSVYDQWDIAKSPATNFTLSPDKLTGTLTQLASRSGLAIIGVSTGKFYWECKITNNVGSNAFAVFGVGTSSYTNYNGYLGTDAQGFGWYSNGFLANGGLGGAVGTFLAGDVVSIALDMTNGAIYFGKNGSWVANGSGVIGVPTSGASKTGSFFNLTGTVYPGWGSVGVYNPFVVVANFGQTTFAYPSMVPSGYYSGIGTP